MAAGTSPIFPNAPIVGIGTLASAAVITARNNITGTTGLTQLTATSTNGTRVDSITAKASSVSTATNIFIWIYNGTTSYLFDELDITSVAAANTVDSASVTKSYTTLTLPSTYQLYISQTVQANATVFAFGGQY